MDQLINPKIINSLLIPWGIKFAVALAILIVGRWLARWLTSAGRRIMAKAGMEQMLIEFLGNIIYMVLLLTVIIAALDHLGLQTTSLLAVVGAAGLAIGLALKDSLGNFASGVMLIIFRPFKVGDFIEAGGAQGVVEQLRMFSTTLRTGDNREITVPNAHIYDGVIINNSARSTRRIDLVFGIGYDDDFAKAKRLIDTIMRADERILDDPAAAVAMAELGDSSVNFNVRPWVKTADYWVVRADLLEKVKLAFDDNNISIPFPQRDVHMHTAA